MSMCDEVRYCSIQLCPRWITYHPRYGFRGTGWTFAIEKDGGVRCPDHKDHPATFVSQGMYR